MRADGRPNVAPRSLGGKPPQRMARLVLACLAAAVVTGRARAADVAPGVEGPLPRGTRDLATLASREVVLDEQAHAARAAVRWRLRALQRLVAPGDALDGVTHARAMFAGTLALARELAEARTLAQERDQLRAERATLAASAGASEAIGPPPALALPVAGAVVVRFGVAPERATGLLLASPGVRLAATPRAPVRAPIAGLVARIGSEPDGAAVVLDDGAGWTVIVGGLAEVSVTEGQRVSAGERLGAALGAPARVGLEVWRGRHPVDPLLLARVPGPRSASAALADPPRLP